MKKILIQIYLSDDLCLQKAMIIQNDTNIEDGKELLVLLSKGIIKQFEMDNVLKEAQDILTKNNGE